MSRTLIFSATRKSFRVDTFRSGGPGGQNQNKVESGVRIVHIPTGLKGESREERSQHANKRKAFERLAALLVKCYTQQYEAQRVLAEATAQTIRTYHEPDNRIVDKACPQRWTYTEVVGKGDISGPLEARRTVLLQKRATDG